MLKSSKIWAIVAVVTVVYMLGYPRKGFDLDPGVLVPDEPFQEAINDPERWKVDDFVFTPLADFEMDARVVRTKHYWFGDESELSPVDAVMAWGPLSDTDQLKRITWKQSGRFYHWRTRDTSVNLRSVSLHTANMHLIPSNSRTRRVIKGLKTDDVVRLAGYLVRVDRPDGWHWVSSMTRSDTGAGACEIIWVEEIEKL